MDNAQHEECRPPLTPDELSARWRVSVKTLANWRSLGRGPRWIKLGGQVRYPLVDVLRGEREGMPAK